MKTISLWNPWAHLVVVGAKRYETRSWPTRYRGPVAIHAAKKWTGELQRLVATTPFRYWWEDEPFTAKGCGEIIGVVNLVDCVPAESVPAELARLNDRKGISNEALLRNLEQICFGDFTAGRWAWKLEQPRRLKKFVKTRGFQGFWNLPDGVEFMVNEELAVL